MKGFILRKALVGLVLVVCFLVQSSVAFAGDSFQVDVDYAVFFNSETGHYIEIYYGFNKSALSTKKSADANKPGEALITARITRNDSFVVNDLWRMQVEKEDSTQNTRLVDMVRYTIVPGEYVLKFYVQNINEPSKTDSVEIDFKVESNVGGDVFLSDIELSTNIKKSPAGKKSNLIKNTLEVIPNPGNLYGEGRPILFFYIEAYNLFSGIKGEKYRTFCWVTDNENNEIGKCPTIKRHKTKKHATSVEVGTFNLSPLKSGIYNFNFAIGEAEDERRVTRSKRFFVYNKSEILAQQKAKRQGAAIEQSEFGRMNLEALDQEFDYMQYLLNDDGKKFFGQLKTADAKRKFIHAFWKSNDPEPKTVDNKFRQQYFDRKDYANEEFGRMGRAGWKTDRGRVYLIYGKPDDRDRYPSSSTTYPYEIWEYNSYEGGVIFVFVDAAGFREYVLVHSTATGELRNDSWEQNRARVFR